MMVEIARNHAIFGIIISRYKSAGAVFEAPPGVAIRRWRSLAMGSYTQLSFTEQVKRCHTCGEVKQLTEFNRDSRSSDGLRHRCKACVRAYNDAWYAANLDHCKARDKAYRERPEIKGRRSAANKAWKIANAEHHKRQRHEYYLANRGEILRKDREYKRRQAAHYREYRKRYWQENRERLSARHKAYYRATRDVRLANDKAYRQANREDICRRQRERYIVNREKHLEEMRRWREKPGNRQRMRDNARQWREANRERFIANIRNRKFLLKKASVMDAETREFFGEVRRDLCSYCGKAGGTLDHIVPIAKGGLHHWTNFAGACIECNMRKKTMSALTFLYRSNRRSGG